MPELPEVETMRRGIAAIAGSMIRAVWCPKSTLRPIDIRPTIRVFSRRAAGRRIEAVDRVGKRIVLRLDSGESIVAEPRMTGRILLAGSPNAEHLRVVFELEGGGARQLLFWDMRGLGVVRLLSPDQSVRELGPEKLGPDALEMTAEAMRERLGKSRRAIKVALMDQRALTGIGNLYASEILHRARLHPELPCQELRRPQWTRLHAAIGEVLREAIACQGSTLRDGNYRNAQNEAGAYQERHQVYQRAGQRCLRCGKGKIVRLVQAQRATFFCPRCQRLPKGRASFPSYSQ